MAGKETRGVYTVDTFETPLDSESSEITKTDIAKYSYDYNPPTVAEIPIFG